MKLTNGALAMMALFTLASCSSGQPSSDSTSGLAKVYASEAGADGAAAGDAAPSQDAASDAAPSPDGGNAKDGGCPHGQKEPKECADLTAKCAQNPNGHECKEMAEACACKEAEDEGDGGCEKK